MLKSLTATILLVAGFLSQVQTGQAVVLVRDGQATARIYLPSGSDRPVKSRSGKELEAPLVTAARELNQHLKKVSGAELKVEFVTDATQIQAPGIVLGSLAVDRGAAPEKTVVSREGFRLQTKGNLLLIGGQSDQAVLLGAYELLEKLGCDWLMPGEIGEVYPRRTTIDTGDLDESQAPDFLIRDLWYTGGEALNTSGATSDLEQWKRRQKGGVYDLPPFQTGGHAWDWFISKHKAEFEKDPTMYALVRLPDGRLKRSGPQLESTHPRVVELFVQDIKDAFKANQWPKDKEVGFPIGPADGSGYSVSPESLAAGSGRIDPITGNLDRTDEVVLLANEIEKRIEGEYPNVWLGFYCYAEHGGYPVRYKPHPRVAQIFAPINFSRFHSLLDTNSKTQPYYRHVVEQWAELSEEQGNALIFRGYSWNLAENMLPFTKLRIWGEEIPYYKKHHFLGISVEAARSWSITGPSDWLMMKLAWNSEQDWKALLKEYCTKAFGAGAAPMNQYFLSLAQRQHDAGKEAGSYYSFPLMYDDDFVQSSEKLFQRAKRLAQSPQEITRIEYFSTPIETLKLYLRYHAASCRFDFAKAKATYQELLQHHEAIQATKTDLVSPYVPLYLNRFLQAFTEQSTLYSQLPYQIVHRLPDELPTLFDPQSSGEDMGYSSPDLNDGAFVPTKTYSSTWDAQGLSSLRGAVWYRHRFQLRRDATGKSVGLFLGGFDDEARVWLNGKYIGSSGQGFSVPAAFDLTDALDAQVDNVLTIQVIKHGLNELGTGGLMKPSFLFVGPRLKQRAPQLPAPQLVRPGAGDVQP